MCSACSIWIIESVQLSSHNRSCTFSTLQRSHCLLSLFIVLENYHQTFVTKLQLFVAPIILFCHPCLCQISNDTTNTFPIDNNSNNTFLSLWCQKNFDDSWSIEIDDREAKVCSAICPVIIKIIRRPSKIKSCLGTDYLHILLGDLWLSGTFWNVLIGTLLLTNNCHPLSSKATSKLFSPTQNHLDSHSHWSPNCLSSSRIPS